MKPLSEILQQDFVSFDEVEEHCDDHADLGTEKKQARAGTFQQPLISFDKSNVKLFRGLRNDRYLQDSMGKKSDQISVPRALDIQTYIGIYGGVIIPPYREAHKYAFQASLAAPLPEFADTFVFWPGGSAGYHEKMRASGAAVVYKRQQQSSVWVHKAFSIIPHCKPYLAKLIAIKQALDMALQMSKKPSPTPPRRIIIFSDCRDALRDIAQLPYIGDAGGGEIMRSFSKISSVLHNLGIRLELRWVPAGLGIPGNIRADGTARKAGNRASRWSPCKQRYQISSFRNIAVYQMVV